MTLPIDTEQWIKPALAETYTAKKQVSAGFKGAGAFQCCRANMCTPSVAHYASCL